MKKIIAIIFICLPFFVMAQTEPPTQVFNGRLYEYKNALKTKIFLPAATDTVGIMPSLLAPGAIIYRLADKSLYQFVDPYWQKIATGSGLAIDSLYRSGDTLFTKDTRGDIDTVVMDYYTKAQVAVLLAGKEDTISSGTGAQYIAGDKTFKPMSLQQVVLVGSGVQPGDTTSKGLGALYYTSRTGTSVSGTPHYRFNTGGFAGIPYSRGQLGLFGLEVGGNTGSNMYLGGVADDGITTIRFIDFLRSDSSAKFYGKVGINSPVQDTNMALNVNGKARINDSVFVKADTATYYNPAAEIAIDIVTGNIVRKFPIAGRVVVQKVGNIYYFGDSQLLGANGGGNPIYSSGGLLLSKYRPTTLFANMEGRKLTVNDYTLGSTKISWFPGDPFIKSIFNATGMLDTSWTGVSLTMPAWNNLGNDVYSTDTTFWPILQRAHEAMIARFVCDNWGGIGTTGLNSANVAGTDSWSTNGLNLNFTVANAESHRINPFYFNQPSIGTKVFMGVTNGQFARFTLKGKKDVGLFYETTPTGGTFNVSINGIQVYTGTSKYAVAQNNTVSNGGRYPGVVWLENVPDSATIQLTSTGTISDTTVFLAYGYTEKGGKSRISQKTILYGTTTGNLKSHNDTLLATNALIVARAVQSFSDYPVYFANPYNNWQNSTDRDPVDSFHLTPSGSQHVVEAFNNAAKLSYKANLLSRPSFNLDAVFYGNVRATGTGVFTGNVTTSAGNVGIGTASPANSLTVFNGTDGNAKISLQSNGNSVFTLQQIGSLLKIGASNEPINILNTGAVGMGGITPTSRLDINGVAGYNQLRLRTAYTPTSSADSNGNTGDVSWDTNYIYIKTAAGWKRSALTTF